MTRLILSACLLLIACVDMTTDASDDPTTPDESVAISEIGTGSAAGKVACWKPSNPGALCTVPTLQSGPPWAGANRCVWSPSIVYSGTCHTGSFTGYSETNCDGPEDCFSAMRCCMHKTGSTYKSSCQSAMCSTGPVRDPLHVPLCHTDADCLAYPWRTCTASSPAADGLPQGLGVCK